MRVTEGRSKWNREGRGAKCATCLTATTVGRGVRAQRSSTARPRVATTDRGEATGVWANYVTHHTRALSYVAQKIGQNVPRFVQILLDGDGCVWSRWSTPTRVGVNISEKLCVYRNDPLKAD